MEQKDKRIEEIKTLYDQLVKEEDINKVSEDQKVVLYQKNQEISEEVLSIVEELLRENELDKDALFWKIRIYNGPYYDDVSVMITTAEEIIDRLAADKRSVLSALDWLAWIYEEKLDLKDKAIEILHDKLIEISMLENQYSLQDKEFGETYYMIAYLYREQEDYETAGAFYKLSYDHNPEHYYATYQGGMLFLKRGVYDLAYCLLNSYYLHHRNEYNIEVAREIETVFQNSEDSIHHGLLSLLYYIGVDYPEQFDAKNSREYGRRFMTRFEGVLQEANDNIIIMEIYLHYYLEVERNSRKAFDLFVSYYALDRRITNTLFYDYYLLAEKFQVDIEEMPVECDPFEGYNLMTSFLQKGGDLKDEGDEKALSYYEEAKRIGERVIVNHEAYFSTGKGHKLNSNEHSYAMLCNNYGIALRNVAKLSVDSYDNEECRQALALHKKGYELSPFTENLNSGLFLAEVLEIHEEVVYFATELLTYYEAYSADWLSTQGRILKSLLSADKYEEAESLYYRIKNGFEKENIEAEKTIAEMVCLAGDFLAYIRYNRKDFVKSITLTEEFFSNPIYFDLVDEVAKVNYWTSLAWSYYGLRDLRKAGEYFDLLLRRFGNDPSYQETIEVIPVEYTIPLEEREAILRLNDLARVEDGGAVKRNLNDHANNVNYLRQIVEWVSGENSITAACWISENCHVKVTPRSLREENKEEIYDTSLDFYFEEANYTIRFNLDERKERKSGLLGVFSKKEWVQAVYVYYYFYTEEKETAESWDVYGTGSYKEIDRITEELWNTWVLKIQKMKTE